MDTFRDFQKAFDPRKILEAHFGRLGMPFGNPMGAFGDYAQYSPKKYFDLGDYYNPEGFFDAKNLLREATR